MQIENDYDKEVYNGDIGFVIPLNAPSIVQKFDPPSLLIRRSVTHQW
jgi:ATP-dependent exoDNAse (exonuclease V) alpha subunit